MESGYYIPTSGQEKMLLENPLRDSLSSLCILCTDECETLEVSKDLAVRTEAYFYQGGQVTWLNFHLAENEAGPVAQTTPSFIKRDSYEEVAKLVDNQRRGCQSVSCINLFHEPGSGGTTLAMHVLWDFRKKLRCAVLRDDKSMVQDIANQVITLFQVGGPGKQNTVLLLIDNLSWAGNLQENLVECVANSPVEGNIPVVIILNCRRVFKGDSQLRKGVTLQMELSEEEQDQFNNKKEQVRMLHGEHSASFHGFNIMQNGFSEEYVKSLTDSILNGVQIHAKNTLLLSFLALLNSYVPGSSLLKSECQTFLGPPHPVDGGPQFEDRMQPFTSLLVIFTRWEKQVRYDRIRIAHPLLATLCCQALVAAGLTVSNMTKSFLRDFYKEQRDKLLTNSISDLLVKRTKGNKFSLLIEKIRESNTWDCRLTLQLASWKLIKNAFIPQALARFLYLSHPKNYSKAEFWARKAIERAPDNSFIADTLGQVHKNHLKNEVHQSLHRQLELARKAIDAFQYQQKVAENEEEAGSEDAESMARKSNIFNHRGKFGHMQVASIVFDILSSLHLMKVLTLDATVESLSGRVNNETFQALMTFKDLITSLKPKVETMFSFFEYYLTYSSASDNDPPYIREQVTACFLQYVTPGAEASEPLTDGVHGKLKRKTAHSFAGLLHWLYQKNRRTEMTEINKLWTEVINSKTSASPSEVLCYLLSNVTLSCVQPLCPFILPFASLKSQVRSLLNKQREELPELFFLALVLLWPDKSESSPSQDEDQEDNPEERDDDLNNLVRQLEKTYDKVYQKYLRSRYLLPHFFLRNGTQYGRIVHRSQVDLWLSESNKAKAEDDAKDNGETQGDQDHAFNQWRSEAAWKNDNIQEQLLRVQGIVKGREVFACYGQLEILVHPDNAAQVRSPGCISFFLGFNMRGPVAFDIQYTSDPHKPIWSN